MVNLLCDECYTKVLEAASGKAVNIKNFNLCSDCQERFDTTCPRCERDKPKENYLCEQCRQEIRKEVSS
jgi:hypothetical protein